MNFIDPNYFLEEEVNWFFNINHFYLAIGVIAFLIFALYIAPIKNKILIKINKVVIALTLMILETARIVYYAHAYFIKNNTLEGLDWVSTISFQMCATMTWSMSFVLIMSLFLKPDNLYLKYNYNFFFGGGMIGAASVFVNPTIIDGRKPIWHFRNIQTILVHCLLVLIPLLLIKWGELKVRFKDVWMNLVGFIFIGTISMSVSIATGHDFAFAKTIPLENIPVIIFPLQQLVILSLMFAGDIVLYLLFELARYIKIKKNAGDLSVFKQDFDFFHYSYYISAISTCLISIAVDMLIAYLVGPSITPKGFLCLIPLFYSLILLILIEFKYKKIDKNLFKNHSKFADAILMINPVILTGILVQKLSKKSA